MMTVRPSAARKKLMPSEPIQVAWTWAIQDPATRPDGPGPLAAKAACMALAFAIHCAASRTSGMAVPATAVQRASAGLRRAEQPGERRRHGRDQDVAGGGSPASPQHHDGEDEDDPEPGDGHVGAQAPVSGRR